MIGIVPVSRFPVRGTASVRVVQVRCTAPVRSNSSVSNY